MKEKIVVINKALFSSKKHDWETPQHFFDELDKEFDIDWDVCATKQNTKVLGCYFSPKEDALKQDWKNNGILWMNPPYGRKIGKWIKKAYEESKNGCTIVALLPARTDTKYFHKYIYKQHEIRFIKGRLKFVGAKHLAPFPSMIVIFRPDGIHL